MKFRDEITLDIELAMKESDSFILDFIKESLKRPHISDNDFSFLIKSLNSVLKVKSKESVSNNYEDLSIVQKAALLANNSVTNFSVINILKSFNVELKLDKSNLTKVA